MPEPGAGRRPRARCGRRRMPSIEVSSLPGSETQRRARRSVRIDTSASSDVRPRVATVSGVFRHLLVLPDGELNEPPVYVTPVPNYGVGETFMLGDGERLRILGIAPVLVDELVELGIGSVFTVEPADLF